MTLRLAPVTNLTPGRTGTRFVRDERGGILVNFALIAPVMLMLLMAMFDYGAAFFDTMALQSAARAAAQYGMADPSDTAGIAAVATSATNLNADDLTVTSSTSCGCANGTAVACGVTPPCPDGSFKRTFVNVSVSKPHTPILPFPFGESVATLSAAATMRIQ